VNVATASAATRKCTKKHSNDEGLLGSTVKEKVVGWKGILTVMDSRFLTPRSFFQFTWHESYCMRIAPGGMAAIKKGE